MHHLKNSRGSVTEKESPTGKRVSKPSLRKWILISVGILAVGLATAGIFLPLLPTTPFLLLAAACFMRSSDKLYRWLTTHRWFGPYIRNYREHQAITRQAKIVTLALLWGTIGYTAFGVVDAPPLRILLLLIAVGVTVHVLRLKTLTRERLSEDSPTDDVERGISHHPIREIFQEGRQTNPQ